MMTRTTDPLLVLHVFSYLPKWIRARSMADAQRGRHWMYVGDGAPSSSVIRWSDASSDPIADIKAEIENVRKHGLGPRIRDYGMAIEGTNGPNGLRITGVSLVEADKAPPGCIVRPVKVDLVAEELAELDRRFQRYGSLCPECGGLPDDRVGPRCGTCGGGE
jgi:hypothetical protein